MAIAVLAQRTRIAKLQRASQHKRKSLQKCNGFPNAKGGRCKTAMNFPNTKGSRCKTAMASPMQKEAVAKLQWLPQCKRKSLQSRNGFPQGKRGPLQKRNGFPNVIRKPLQKHNGFSNVKEAYCKTATGFLARVFEENLVARRSLRTKASRCESVGVAMIAVCNRACYNLFEGGERRR